ncbi:hypothetical protein GCM10029976_034620 [Kribbella albertanoniae]
MLKVRLVPRSRVPRAIPCVIRWIFVTEHPRSTGCGEDPPPESVADPPQTDSGKKARRPVPCKFPNVRTVGGGPSDPSDVSWEPGVTSEQSEAGPPILRTLAGNRG